MVLLLFYFIIIILAKLFQLFEQIHLFHNSYYSERKLSHLFKCLIEMFYLWKEFNISYLYVAG